MLDPPDTPRTVVIADDHPLLRAALEKEVAGRLGFRVVASVPDVQAALAACQQFQPDILILDIVMPGRASLTALGELREISPGTRVVVLSAFCRDAFIDLAINSGAAGYLLKTEPPERITEALMRVARGERVYSDAVAARLATLKRHPQSRLKLLTPREIEVLSYVGRGWSNSRMADEMHLSKRTVERHISRLMKSLDIYDRTQLARYAFQEGLVV